MDIREVEQAIKDIETGSCHQDRHYYRKCMEFMMGEIKALEARQEAAGKSWMAALMEAFK